jgi:hypothetical protein
MRSRITGGETRFLFTAKVLNKYDVSYFRCCETGFIQTEAPYWLSEAYSTAITKLDVGLVRRNVELSKRVPPVLVSHFNHNGKFLDYAGGYGMFTRLMRDLGFDFYTTDKYCDNLFAENYDAGKEPFANFELVTAFEVFEHLADPIKEIPEILQYAPNLLFSTEVPPEGITGPAGWWYFSLETGQHVSFYSIKSLEYLAVKFNRHFYTDGKGLHLFTEKPLTEDPLKPAREKFLIRKMRKKLERYDRERFGSKEGLIDHDWKQAKEKLGRGD